MHLFLRIAIFTSFSWGMLHSFEQLPHEIITKIVVLEPQILIALSVTNKATCNTLLEWAGSHDASFLIDTENGYTSRNVRFILKQNKSTDVGVGQAALSLVRALIESKASHSNADELNVIAKQEERLKVIASARPWAVQRYEYNHQKDASIATLYGVIDALITAGFLLPLVYVNCKPIPMMHYLVKQYWDSSAATNKQVSNLVDVLLAQGMNPFFVHENKTVVSCVKKNNTRTVSVFDDYDNILKQNCFKYARVPNDPHVVMYHTAKILTIEAIQQQICIKATQ